MGDSARQVLPYSQGDGFVPVTDSPAELVWAMLDRDFSLAEVAQQVGSAELTVTAARDWAMRRYPVPAQPGDCCAGCGARCEETHALVVRLIASLEAGARGELLYELPPFPVFFPLCNRCARRRRLFVRASNHWHRPAMLIGIGWAASIAAAALLSLFWSDDRYSRFMSFTTLASFATVVALLVLFLLWNLKNLCLTHDVRWQLMRRFRVHSIDVLNLADGREASVVAVSSNGTRA